MKQIPKYYLWMKQEGEGCDYTIGCGEHLVALNTRKQSVYNAIIQTFKDYGIGESDERLLSNCLLLTANDDSSMPIYLEYIKGLEAIQDQSLIQELQQERDAINQRLTLLGAT